MNILVLGGTTFTDRVRLFDVLDGLSHQVGVTRILCDADAGPNSLGRAWAETRNVEFQSVAVSANLKSWGKRARKSGKLASDQPNIVIVFPDAGVETLIRQVKEIGMTVLEVDSPSSHAQPCAPDPASVQRVGVSAA